MSFLLPLISLIFAHFFFGWLYIYGLLSRGADGEKKGAGRVCDDAVRMRVVLGRRVPFC